MAKKVSLLNKYSIHSNMPDKLSLHLETRIPVRTKKIGNYPMLPSLACQRFVFFHLGYLSPVDDSDGRPFFFFFSHIESSSEVRIPTPVSINPYVHTNTLHFNKKWGMRKTFPLDWTSSINIWWFENQESNFKSFKLQEERLRIRFCRMNECNQQSYRTFGAMWIKQLSVSHT